ncbi:MAG: hypothetical protein ACM3VT_09560 [Solirubrobacterales bacterium]
MNTLIISALSRLWRPEWRPQNQFYVLHRQPQMAGALVEAVDVLPVQQEYIRQINGQLRRCLGIETHFEIFHAKPQDDS